VAPATDVLVLLRAARLADRFLVSQTVAQLLASQLARVQIDSITDDVVALAFATPLPLELMDKCRVYLWSAFRHVPDVVTQPGMLARFCGLPHAAVVAWAKSGSLQVHSENDVVYLLSAWVAAQKTAGCPCSAAQMVQLVHSVRLADCGRTYLQMVVPSLDWFKSGLKALDKFVMSLELDKAGMQHTRPPSVPDAWWAAEPRELATCEAVREFQVKPEKLEVLDAGDAGCRRLGSVFVNGFWMKAFLECRASETVPEVTLGCYTLVDAAKMSKIVPWPEHAAVAFSCSMQVGEAAMKDTGNYVVTGLDSWGYPDTLDASAASVTALVAPHLEGGQLKGKVTFANVDLLSRRA
jgi:hypothetical protein